jgi:hypothetical protein
MEGGGWASPRIGKEKRRAQKRAAARFFIVYYLTHYRVISKPYVEAGFLSGTVLIKNQFLQVKL